MISQRHINSFTNVVLFVDDTSILIKLKNYENLNQKISITLDCTSRWVQESNSYLCTASFVCSEETALIGRISDVVWSGRGPDFFA